MLTVLVLVFTCAVAVYLFYLRRSRYWKERNIPGPTGSLFLGSARDLLLKNNHRAFQLRKWTKEYGKTYGVMEGIRPLLVTSDINIVQEVFVKQFDNFHGRWNLFANDLDKNPKVTLADSRGTKWKRLRTISTPSFSIGNLKKVRPIVEDSARCMVDIMEKRHADGAPFNIHERIPSQFILIAINGEKMWMSSIQIGPRICIGMRLAMMEEKMALAHLLRKFNILTGAKDEELKLHGCFTIIPLEVPVRIERRR